MKLKGIAAIITGASGQLGTAIAKALAASGCDCICHYHRRRHLAEETAEQIREMGARALVLGADLSQPEQIDELFEKAAQFAVPQILINSASVFFRQQLADVTFEKAQEVLNLNLTTPILMSRAFTEVIEAKFGNTQDVVGKIINMSDVCGIRPWAGYVLYSASKAGLIGATKALAKELAPKICVNSIAPGLVRWPKGFDEAAKKQQLSFIPVGRIAETKDVTRAIIFLLENDYITGQVLNIDGGRCI